MRISRAEQLQLPTIPRSMSISASACVRLLSLGTRKFAAPLVSQRSRMESTTWQEHADAWPAHAIGAYARTRAKLPPPPAAYGPARVAIQDKVVASCLAGVIGNRARPWLVFTCGAMGAGKSHTLRALAGTGAFPLLAAGAAVADPDLIKQALPDLAALVAAEPHLAHTRVHAESGYLSEIVAREALTARAHLIVDGTLRDSEYYAAHIAATRAEFPAYRVAILHVVAPRELVLARAARRAAATGRFVPTATLDDAMARCPRSFHRLAPLADFSAEIANDSDGALPRVLPPASLELFAAMFAEPSSLAAPVGASVTLA